ncbi:MAG: ABC transporter ATP-binding protein, partial [Candidatus Korarchaeota archaeon]
MSITETIEEEEIKIFHYTVECINISKSIGIFIKRPLLRNVTLNVPQGIFGILGPRGSGVSTLLKIIAGVISPNTGKARVLGYDMSREYLKAKRLIGYVPQRIHISRLTFEERTGKEFLINQGIEKGLTPYDAEEKAILIGKRLNIQRYLDVDLDKYTDAMKHLLLLGAAIMHDPQVLILDEPFVNYDYRTVNRIVDVIQQYKGEKRTVVIGTSFLPDILPLVDELAILLQARDRAGKALGSVIVFQGTPAQLLKKINPNKFKVGVTELDLMLEAIIQEGTVLEAYIEKRARSALRGTRGMLNRGIIAVTTSDYKVFWKTFRDIVHEYGAIADYYNTVPPLEQVFAKEIERVKIAGPLIAQRAEVVKAAWDELGKGNMLEAAKLFFKAADISARLG